MKKRSAENPAATPRGKKRAAPGEADGHLTMGRIAEELGLSRRTVSSVLNDLAAERGISEATARRVSDYAARRGYVQDRGAMRMRRAAADAFGLLAVGKLYTHLYDALNLFSDYAADHPQGMETVFCRADGVAAGLEELAARRLDRVVWLHAQAPEWLPGGRDAAMALLSRFGRVVVYNCPFPLGRTAEAAGWRGERVARVGVDRMRAYRQMGRHLASLGHRRVALASAWIGQDGSAWARGVAAAGLAGFAARPDDLPMPGDGRPETGERLAVAIRELMAREGVTAACFGDDVEAGYAMRALAEMGVRVPGELSVTGFNGLALGALFAPPLTTLVMPVAEMVRAALELLALPGGDAGERVLPMSLCARASSVPVG